MENNQNQVPESIWADGIVPEKVDPKFLFNMQELLLMAMDFIVRVFAPQNGFKIDATNPDTKQLPNIIMSRDDKTYAIAVVPSVFPRGAVLRPDIKDAFYKKCVENNATGVYMPVVIASRDEKRKAAGCLLKGDIYNMMFRGGVILDDNPDQDLKDPKNFTSFKIAE